jgi:uncharacterized protein
MLLSPIMQGLWFLPIGIVTGAYGTIIGAGGGLILMPVLLLLYPHEAPALLTSTSLCAVFANSVSGSLAFARMRRADYKAGLLFAAATVPGAFLGSYLADFFPRLAFQRVFGGFLVLVAAYLLLKGRSGKAAAPGNTGPFTLRYSVTESDGTVHSQAYNALLGFLVSLLTGFIASILGIGGGIIHVPLMTYVLSFPIAVATATSTFILMFTSLSSIVTHVVRGTISPDWVRTVSVVVGVVMGAQVGARIAKRIKGSWTVKALACGLIIAGGRLLIG